MQTNELNSIRYLMGQMSPSEMIEFEHEMRNDADLLIEVESLRSSYNRLEEVPTISAPKDVLESVSENVIKLQKHNIKKSKWYGRNITKGAAAVIALTMAVSVVFFNTNENKNIEDVKIEPIQSVVEQTPTPVSTQNNVAPVADKIDNKTQPWVDRNEIIKVGDQLNTIRLKNLDKEYTDSYNKLILVKPSQDILAPNKEIHYTNSTSNQ